MDRDQLLFIYVLFLLLGFYYINTGLVIRNEYLILTGFIIYMYLANIM